MKISIVIPNLNGERYLRECLESGLAQGGVAAEYIEVDGGSTDGSLDILREYERCQVRWISEYDQGQSDAINKGLRLATGDIVAYLNSDDLLEPGALRVVAGFFGEHTEAEWLAGTCRLFGPQMASWYLEPKGWSTLVDTVLPWDREQDYVFPQSGACFMRRSLITRIGPFLTELHYCMDMEYYARAAFAGAQMHVIPDVLAAFRWHPTGKSVRAGCAYGFRKEEVTILGRYIDRLPPEQRMKALRTIERERRSAVISEANYWSSHRERLRSIRLLGGLATSEPRCLVDRMWLGALRRAVLRPDSPTSRALARPRVPHEL